jgi:NADPH:quinone reductase-like Zn-dependent oxidoreductase
MFVQAVVIEKPGGPEVLKLKDVGDIHAQRGEIRVRVRASAVNRADLLQRAGKYPAPPGCSADIPGLEYAGEVDELGDSHSGWKIGDRVFGLVPGGSYAEYVVVHPRTAVGIPDHLSFEDAAALPEAAITAYDAMVLQAGLKSGDYVLITAAASGVASIAVQIASALGARSIGLTRSEDKRTRLLQEGSYQSVLLTDGKEFAEEVKRITGGAGVDVIVELVGGH